MMRTDLFNRAKYKPVLTITRYGNAVFSLIAVLSSETRGGNGNYLIQVVMSAKFKTVTHYEIEYLSSECVATEKVNSKTERRVWSECYGE
jgi:hypothetical protein